MGAPELTHEMADSTHSNLFTSVHFDYSDFFFPRYFDFYILFPLHFFPLLFSSIWMYSRIDIVPYGCNILVSCVCVCILFFDLKETRSLEMRQPGSLIYIHDPIDIYLFIYVHNDEKAKQRKRR